MPLGPSQNYLAKYNSYILPGYVQEERFDSSLAIGNHQALYADGSLSEYLGLDNKTLSLTLKVWESDYLACKREVQRAATFLRSKRGDFAPMYLQYSDRHYLAMTKAITTQKTAGTSVRTLDYTVELECKPWIIHDTLQTLTGTATLTTNQVGRTDLDGAWTPTIITMTGTNITVSGYTDTIPYTGFISVSGSVTNLVVNSEDFTAEISGLNANDRMLYADYQTFVGPGKTSFDVTGANSVTIEYYNRWYI